MDHVWEVHNDVSSYLFDSHQAAEWFKNLQPATVNMQLTQRKVMVTKASDDLVAEVVRRALEYYATAYGDLTLTSSVIARAVAGSLDENERSAKAIALAETLGYCWTGAGWLKATSPADRPVPDRRTALESTQEGRAVIAQAQADIATPAPAPQPVQGERDLRSLNFDADDEGLLVCWGQHEKSAGCQMERLNPHEALKLMNEMQSALMQARAAMGYAEDAKAELRALVRSLAATPAPANNADTERLDYLQKGGVTLHLVPDHEDPGNAFAYKFCVGGLWKATSRDLREAIDTAKATQKVNQND